MGLVNFDVDQESACLDERLLNKICGENIIEVKGKSNTWGSGGTGANRDSNRGYQNHGGRDTYKKGYDKQDDYNKHKHIQCNKCGEYGHYANNCYSGKRDYQRYGNNDNDKVSLHPMKNPKFQNYKKY